MDASTYGLEKVFLQKDEEDVWKLMSSTIKQLKITELSYTHQ